jgi:3-oxoadipate enol-lactonase
MTTRSVILAKAQIQGGSLTYRVAIMDMMLAQGTVSARITGEGRPLILFHSLLSDRASFAAIEGPLAARFKVVVPELPGFGGSAAVAGDLDSVADRMAEAVRDAAQGEGPIVLGNGYGGFVALNMTIRHPDLVSRLVLADCGAAFKEEGRQAFRNMAVAAATKGLAAITDLAMTRLFAADFQAAHPDLMQERREAFSRTDPDVFRHACEALAELDLRPALGGIKIPVFVLVGQEDQATPPAMSRELARGIPDSQMVVMRGCAHVPPLQAPEAFLNAIAEFLDAAPAAA